MLLPLSRRSSFWSRERVSSSIESQTPETGSAQETLPSAGRTRKAQDPTLPCGPVSGNRPQGGDGDVCPSIQMPLPRRAWPVADCHPARTRTLRPHGPRPCDSGLCEPPPAAGSFSSPSWVKLRRRTATSAHAREGRGRDRAAREAGTCHDPALPGILCQSVGPRPRPTAREPVCSAPELP